MSVGIPTIVILLQYECQHFCTQVYATPFYLEQQFQFAISFMIG